MNAKSTYNEHILEARKSLLATKVALLLAYGTAPDCPTEGKVMTIVKVINLIDQEFAHLQHKAT